MLLKLVAYGTLAYVGFKYLQSAGAIKTASGSTPSDLRIAGGPLSDQARVQHTADEPPPPVYPQQA